MMFCIPRKRDVLADDGIRIEKHRERKGKALRWRCFGSKRAKSERKVKAKKLPKGNRPPSPTLEDEQPPWVTGHRVFVVDKEGRSGSFA